MHPRKTAIFIIWCGIIYFILYLWQGRFGEIYNLHVYKHFGKFATQGETWVGTAAAVFPLIITIPATLLLSKDKSISKLFLVSFSLIISLYSCVYFDVRIGLLCFWGYLILSVLSGSMNKLLFVLSTLLIGLFLLNPERMDKAVKIIAPRTIQLTETANFFIKPAKSDFGRKQHLKAGFIRLFNNPVTFLVGDGYYVSRFSLRKPLLQVGAQYNYAHTSSIQTIGLSAFMVDTGILGVFLLCINFYFATKVALLRIKGYDILNRLFAIFIIVFTFLWLIIVNIQDDVLYFLLFMPGGLLIQLCQYDWRALDRTLIINRKTSFKFGKGYSSS